MQRISVDLPEPVGPQITIRSLRATARSMSRSTWKSPNHLFSFSTRIIGSAVMRSFVSGAAVCVKAALDEQRITRHGKAPYPVDDAGEGEAGEQCRRRCPVRVGEGGAQLAEQIEDGNDQHQRGVLAQCDETVDETRDDVAQR